MEHYMLNSIESLVRVMSAVAGIQLDNNVSKIINQRELGFGTEVGAPDCGRRNARYGNKYNEKVSRADLLQNGHAICVALAPCIRAILISKLTSASIPPTYMYIYICS
jgi:hypothetical protein